MSAEERFFLASTEPSDPRGCALFSDAVPISIERVSRMLTMEEIVGMVEAGSELDINLRVHTMSWYKGLPHGDLSRLPLMTVRETRKGDRIIFPIVDTGRDRMPLYLGTVK